MAPSNNPPQRNSVIPPSLCPKHRRNVILCRSSNIMLSRRFWGEEFWVETKPYLAGSYKFSSPPVNYPSVAISLTYSWEVTQSQSTSVDSFRSGSSSLAKCCHHWESTSFSTWAIGLATKVFNQWGGGVCYCVSASVESAISL